DVFGVTLQHGPDRVQHLVDRLVELRLVGVEVADRLEDGLRRSAERMEIGSGIGHAGSFLKGGWGMRAIVSHDASPDQAEFSPYNPLRGALTSCHPVFCRPAATPLTESSSSRCRSGVCTGSVVAVVRSARKARSCSS